MKHLNIYNPNQQTKKELVENFIIRINEFEKIYNVIKTDVMKNAPQHFIIQGVRGSGKTTLLLRIYYEIIENEKLNKWLIPIRFNEEQYGISKLYKLWENIANELENSDDTYLGLLDEMQKSIENDNYEEHCYNLLFKKLKDNKKKIIVFIDNIGDRLDKFSKKEQQRLREVLITNNNIRLIGSSSVVLESTYNYKEAFYDFFKIINLNELKKEETKTFLLQLDKDNKEKTIEEIIKNQPGRIEALRILTGGIPRTMVLLYEIFVKDSNGDSFHNLEVLLDSVTPLYKHRMDDLSTQQQEIVDVIALNWDAIPVKEIVRKTRYESKAVSSQLNLLEKNNIIIKKSTSTKNNYYQLKERFFNIWYLMRNGRNSDKSKIKWLTKFLEVWCNSGDLENMIKSHIHKLRSEKLYDKYAYHVSEAYARIVSSADLQKELLDESKKYLTSIGSELSRELSEPDVDYLKNVVDEIVKSNDYQKAIKKLLTINSNTGVIERTIAEIYDAFIKDFEKAEKYYLKAIEKNQSEAMSNLALLYQIEFKNLIKAEKYFMMAIEHGNDIALYNLGFFYQTELKDNKKAEKYYLKAIEKEDSNAMNNLALLYENELKNYYRAEKYYKMAAEKGNVLATSNLAILYETKLENFVKAEKYYLMAIEKGSSDAILNLALLYELEMNDYRKAEKYYLMAIQNGEVIAMSFLALLYENKFKDYNNAEKYYLMAIQKEDVESLSNLSLMYFTLKKEKENALNYSKLYIEKEKSNLTDFNYINNLLWNNLIEEGNNLAKEMFNKQIFIDKFQSEIKLLLLMLIAKKQYNFTYKLFEENKYNLKDRYKPIYYALMSFMKDSHPDELNKMGEELKEVVESIIKEINQLGIDYA